MRMSNRRSGEWAWPEPKSLPYCAGCGRPLRMEEVASSLCPICSGFRQRQDVAQFNARLRFGCAMLHRDGTGKENEE